MDHSPMAQYHLPATQTGLSSTSGFEYGHPISSTTSATQYEKLGSGPHMTYPVEDEDTAHHASHTHKGEKVVLTALWRLYRDLLVYPIPVGITIGLLWMSFNQVYWFAEDIEGIGSSHILGSVLGPTSIMNLLQLAAKIHEIVMIGSLATIMLNLFKNRLIGAGVPLGLLSAGYRVGDLGYVISSPFWKGVKANPSSPRWLALMLIFITILSTILGPASAILMIPSLGWFSLPDPFYDLQFPLYYNAKPSAVWPQQLTNSLLLGLPECSTSEATYTSYCPAGGYSQIYNWASGFRYNGLNSNISFQVPTTGLNRELVVGEPPFTPATFLTTVSNPSMLAIGRLVDYIQASDVGPISQGLKYQITTAAETENLQPIVQGQCTLYDRDECRSGAITPLYVSSGIECFDSKGCLDWQSRETAVASYVWNSSDAYDNYRIITSASESDGYEGSVILYSGFLPYNGNDTQKSWVFACNMVSHWAPSDLTVEPRTSDIVESSVGVPQSHDDMLGLGVQADNHIQFAESWVVYLSPKYNATLYSDDEVIDGSTSPLAQLFEQFLVRNSRTLIRYMNMGPSADGQDNYNLTEVTNILQRVIGATIVDGLARNNANLSVFSINYQDDNTFNLSQIGLSLGFGRDYSYVTNVTSQGNSSLWIDGVFYRSQSSPVSLLSDTFQNDTQFGFEFSRYGYGSGQPGATLTFGVAIMLIYLGILGVYFLFAIVAFVGEKIGHGVISNGMRKVVAWDDLQDLLFLALRSAKTNSLYNVKRKSAWGKNVNLRSDETGAIWMLVDEDAPHLLVPEKKRLYHT